MSIQSPTGDPVAISSVGRALDRTAGWRILHDVRWPGHPQARLAHVAVGPGGVVVVLEDGPNLHEGVRDGAAENLACATAAVTALLGPAHRKTVRGLHAVERRGETSTRAALVPAALLPDVLAQLPHVLTPLETVIVAAHLRVELDPTGAAHRVARVPQPTAAPEPGAEASDEQQATDPTTDVRPRLRRRWWPLGPGRLTGLLVVAGLVLPWTAGLVVHAL
ncbi:hypothetical protein [Cellulomonas citrea]|uniref:hypothetical protein n=1 Tax=Cellulomonas citrea TaxID=1909423 RepID=UPI001356C6ED|nr:hypothetical protein [Cellulomonas citrea]